jgi:hypothetical protein
MNIVEYMIMCTTSDRNFNAIRDAMCMVLNIQLDVYNF